MSDVFTRAETAFGGAFDSNQAAISFGALDIALVQSANFNHNYAVQRLYELGSLNSQVDTRSRVYYLAGRTSGNLALSRILGPAAGIKAFYDKYGDVCNVENSDDQNSLRLRFVQGCGSEGTLNSDVTYICKYALLIGVALAVQSGEITIFNESMNLMFTGMDFSEGLAAAAAAGGIAGAT